MKLKLKVIVNNNPKPIRPYYIYDKVGWDDFVTDFYCFLSKIKVIEDEEEFLSFLSTNREILQLLVHAKVKHTAHLKELLLQSLKWRTTH